MPRQVRDWTGGYGFTRYLFGALFTLGVLGCALPPPPTVAATPAQAEWFALRDSFSPSFGVSEEESDPAWSRAKLWLATYSDFKLQTIDSEILETYLPPSEAGIRFGYQVTRQKQAPGSWFFRVRCVTGNRFAVNEAAQKARSLAVYISTGRDCPGCGGGVPGRPSL